MRMPAVTFAELQRLAELRSEAERLRGCSGYDARVKVKHLDAAFAEGAAEIWPLVMSYAHAWAGQQSSDA